MVGDEVREAKCRGGRRNEQRRGKYVTRSKIRIFVASWKSSEEIVSGVSAGLCKKC